MRGSTKTKAKDSGLAAMKSAHMLTNEVNVFPETLPLPPNHNISSGKIRCLLIDDDVDDQEIFSIALDRLKVAVECEYANGGRQALEALSNSAGIPDYIFIDINMPRMNGRECLEAIKKLTHLSEVPVFMYSTSEDPNIVSETKKLGAKDFIVKPATVADLSVILHEILVQNNYL